MRETWLRLAVKSLEWRLSGVLLSAILGQATIGDWRTGALFGGLYNLLRLLLMPIRDRLWAMTHWQTIPSHNPHKPPKRIP